MKRSIAWGIGISLVATALAGACGSSVTDTSGSGGGNGGKGTPSSSSKATTGGTGGTGGTVGTGGSGGMGTGGGDACTKACNHATGCGENLCSQFQLDCSTQEGTCLAACINSANCQDIMDAANWLGDMTGTPPSLIICAAPCIQGGTGGGGQGGNGAGGGSLMACEQCAEGSCAAPIQACAQDAACQGWFNCAMGCGFNNDPCLTMCDQMNPGAATDYDAIYSCACTNCSTQCMQINACAHLPDGGMGSASASTGAM